MEPTHCATRHCSTDHHRLAGELVVDRDERMMRRERTRRALLLHA
jgi:hypothetical protein